MSDMDALKIMVRGAYDLQKIRIQTGLRLVANFRSKLTDQPGEETGEAKEISEEGQKIIDQLKASYRRLTDGVAKNRTLPDQHKFVGDALISTFAELTLVNQYVGIEKQESLSFRLMVSTLERIPIYNSYLEAQVGIGPAMAGVLLTYLNPHDAPYVSSFWMYAGLDVAADGAGRSRREEHLVEHEYINKKGQTATRLGVTYNPFLKTKLVGVLGPSFMRSNSPWRKVYDDYKNRLLSDPAREKCNISEWKKRYAAGEDVSNLWPPGRINMASNRYMVKMFLQEFWQKWRAAEGLPVTPTYQEAKLGHTHRAA